MRPPSFPSIALCLGLTGSQVFAFFGEVPSHALKDPINVPPIRIEELYPHLRKRGEDWSRFNLQDEVKLLWAHNNHDERVVFDMEIQKPDQKHPLLALEELDTFTESIICQEPTITLKFRSEEAIDRAEEAWGWINRADTDYFYLIANHDGCGPDAMRHPYKVVEVKHDNKTLTTVFTTQNVDWEEVTPNHKMSIGTSKYARRASVYNASPYAGIVRRAATETPPDCGYFSRMFGTGCGLVKRNFLENLKSGWDNLVNSFSNFPSDVAKGAKGAERIPSALVDAGVTLVNGVEKIPSEVAKGVKSMEGIPSALFDAGVTFANGMKRIPSELADAGETFVDGVSRIPDEVGQAASHNFQLASGFVFTIAGELVQDIISNAAGGAKSVAKIVEKIADFEEALVLLLMGKPLTFDFASKPEDANMLLYPPVTTGPVEFSSQCQGCNTKGSLTIRAEWFMNGGSLLNPIFWVETKEVTGSLPIKHKVSVDIKSTEEDDTVALVPLPGLSPFTIGAVSIGPVVLVGGGFEGKLKVAGAFTTGINYTIPDGKLEFRPSTPGESRLTGFEQGLEFKPSLDLDELNMLGELSVFGMTRLGVALEWGKGTTLGAWADFKGGLKGTLKIGALDKGECPAQFVPSVTGLVGEKVDKTEKVEGKTTGAKAALSTFYEISVAAGLSVGKAKVSFKMVDGGTELAGVCFAAPFDILNAAKMAALVPLELTRLQTGKVEKKEGTKYDKQTFTKGEIEPGMILVKGVAPQLFKVDGGSQTVMAQ
ncbi:uncharacterized protein DFL_003148 [Arthrobotrys flagrans]|uniref:DUF7029 domain-containing protein n=1 Tax=Arthrobotrys flagrans TaxID=97331 RepID=A0A437A112_ARTFL|nr:hypothetical protein DFL_003148 [Arthrobotrys flagrans]